MDCPNCNFINMPSLRQCARCGSQLTFDDVSIAPPRASESVLPLAVRHSMYRSFMELRHDAGRSFLSTRTFLRSVGPPHTLLAGLIPGGGQRILGLNRLATIFFCSWLVALFLTIYMLGTGWIWLFYSILLGIHSLAYTLLFSRLLEQFSLPRRMLFGLALYLVLTGVLYFPGSWLIHRVVEPVNLNDIPKNATLSNDDVILTTGPWIHPTINRGDIIMRRVDEANLGGIVIREGVIIDRVIGLPGDHVVRTGQLLCNGVPVPSELGPLCAIPMSDFDLVLSEDQFLVIPSTFTVRYYNNAGFPALTQLSIVDRNQILGKAYFRSHPLSRVGTLTPAISNAAPMPTDVSAPVRDTPAPDGVPNQ